MTRTTRTSRWSQWRQVTAQRLGNFVQRRIRPIVLRGSVRHVAGPTRVVYGPDEVLLICVVRNGAYHVRDYIDHHLRLGVRHIVFLDNDSTDETVAIAREYEAVTVLRTDRPYRVYENTMKRYLAGRFSSDRWNLCVDIDERFDYPHSDVMPLREFVRYLNERGYTAAIAQMLDMFSELPIREAQGIRAGELSERCAQYDLAAIRKIDYRFGVPGHPAIREHFGGIRRSVFGSDNGLTKAALVRVRDSRELFVGWHHVGRARLADVSCALLHYPFVGSFPEKVAEAIAAWRYGKFTADYVRYADWLRRNPDGLITSETARRLNSVNDLLEDGFLVASDEYLERVAAVSAGRHAGGVSSDGSRA